jgi:hypothetical protein
MVFPSSTTIVPLFIFSTDYINQTTTVMNMTRNLDVTFTLTECNTSCAYGYTCPNGISHSPYALTFFPSPSPLPLIFIILVYGCGFAFTKLLAPLQFATYEGPCEVGSIFIFVLNGTLAFISSNYFSL